MEFNKAYNRQEFVNFLQSSFLPNDFLPTTEAVAFAPMKYTSEVVKLGSSQTLDLVVYEIKHSSHHDARVALSKEAFRLLADEMEDRALVVFVPKDNCNNYRFSFIEITLDIAEDSSRVTRNYSNPRRYSYYLGKGIAYYTPNKYLNEKGRVVDDDDLHSRFSVEVLTKEFYNELSDWYAWAIQIIRFPNDINDDTDDAKYNNESAIRLITRLIFVWFLKQRRLIPNEFFDEKFIADNLIEGFNPHAKVDLFNKSKESKYYKAILQNLFFAMLNSPITAEGSDKLSERHFRNGRGDYDNNKLMRYEYYFSNPQMFVNLANSTVPFLNGGLFDCLDDKDNGMYYDGFSDRESIRNSLILPDYLFFGEEMGKNIDLSKWYGDKKKKKVSARGIIDILKRYNFTVEENTPFDQEVSLDPELLGKVFENLLASYNPETQTTARKQTGSFYTPREIVQYMVDESLVAHLKRTVGEELEPKFRELLQYTDEPIDFTDEQRKSIMQSLYNCKILDPACGSGAFPMGMLQQMVHILGRIDPDNEQWKEMMMNQAINETTEAFKSATKEERQEQIADIERSFDEGVNRPDYARKLYLIENCIYGVDIQPIAIQISKLRFFISLVVDQKTNAYPTDNFGIRPLPNLEAKFVAANTLIGITSDLSLADQAESVRSLKQQLKTAKHKIFSAKTVRTKRKYKELVNEYRIAIANELESLGFIDTTETNQLASWDMFDQNVSSTFFDKDWMFGVKEGFDIVIGNPPFGAKLSGKDKALYRKIYPETQFKIDTYSLFILRSMYLLSKFGICSFILPNTLLDNYFEEQVRRKILGSFSLNEINDLNDKVFDGAVVHAMIMSFLNKQSVGHFVKVNSKENLYDEPEIIPASYFLNQPNCMISIRTYKDQELLDKISSNCKLLEEVIDIRQAIKSGNDKLYISKCRENANYKPILRGKDIGKYCITFPNLYINYGKHLACPRKHGIFEQPKILIREAGAVITAAYDDENYYIMSSLYNALLIDNQFNLKYILALINSSLYQYLMNKLTFEKTKGAFTKAKIYHYYKLPVKVTTNQDSIINLVDYIMEQKRIDINSDTSKEEQEIDRLVYKLYGLTYDEVKVIDPETPITEEEYYKK
jgi:adenine-specific DNA-methyltransferase